MHPKFEFSVCQTTTLQKILTSCWLLWLASISPAWSQQSLAWEDPARYTVTRFGTDSLDRGIYLIKDQQDFLVVAFSYHHHAQLMLAGLDKKARIQWQRVWGTPQKSQIPSATP